MRANKKMTNLNELAKTITLKEGKKKNVDVAQVKEIMKLTFEELAKMDCVEVLTLLKKYKLKTFLKL